MARLPKEYLPPGGALLRREVRIGDVGDDASFRRQRRGVPPAVASGLDRGDPFTAPIGDDPDERNLLVDAQARDSQPRHDKPGTAGRVHDPLARPAVVHAPGARRAVDRAHALVHDRHTDVARHVAEGLVEGAAVEVPPVTGPVRHEGVVHELRGPPGGGGAVGGGVAVEHVRAEDGGDELTAAGRKGLARPRTQATSLVEEHDPMTAAGGRDGEGAPGRATPDDDDVGHGQPLKTRPPGLGPAYANGSTLPTSPDIVMRATRLRAGLVR